MTVQAVRPADIEHFRRVQESLVNAQRPWIQLKAKIYRNCGGYALSPDGGFKPFFTAEQEKLLSGIEDALNAILRIHESNLGATPQLW